MDIDSGDECPRLSASLGHTRDWTLGRFIDTAHAYVAAFMKLHPKFSDLRLCGTSAKDSPPLNTDLSNLRDWMMRRSWSDHRPQDYSERDADGKPTVLSSGSLGFDLTLTNATGFGRKLDLCIRNIGARRFSSSIEIDLARKAHPEFQTEAMALDLLNLTAQHWPVDRAYFAHSGWGPQVLYNDPPEKRGPNVVGWLTYSSNPAVAQLLPPHMALDHCPFGPGLLVQLTPHMSRYDDPADVARGLAFKAALNDAGLYAELMRA
jgi:hypothetical protein